MRLDEALLEVEAVFLEHEKRFGPGFFDRLRCMPPGDVHRGALLRDLLAVLTKIDMKERKKR